MPLLPLKILLNIVSILYYILHATLEVLPHVFFVCFPPSDSVTPFKVRTPPLHTSFSHNQNSNGSTDVVSEAICSRQHFLNQPIAFTLYCLHHTIRYGYSASPTIAHCLPHTSCRLDVCFEIEWLDWFFSRKAFQKSEQKKKSMWALLALKIRLYIFNGHCCDSKASSSRFCVLIQVLLCKFK